MLDKNKKNSSQLLHIIQLSFFIVTSIHKYCKLSASVFTIFSLFLWVHTHTNSQQHIMKDKNNGIYLGTLIILDMSASSSSTHLLSLDNHKHHHTPC